jgi:hypothetical protein
VVHHAANDAPATVIGPMFKIPQINPGRAGLAILITAYLVVFCVSLVDAALFRYPISSFDPKVFHILYDPAQLFGAIAVVSAFAVVAVLFVIAEFSFGYFVGFYLYTMVFGYLWLSHFSDFTYDRTRAGISAAISAIAFLLPALLVTSPLKRRYRVSEHKFETILHLIVIVSAAIILAEASYNFRLVFLEDIYEFRDSLESPRFLNYLMGMASSALLPFAFACFVMRNNYWRAAAVLVLLLLVYPITLSKISFFAPLWLAAIALLSRVFEARATVVLSLLVPALAGVIGFAWSGLGTAKYFGTVNFRMIAIPSNSLDVYTDFFSTHELTWFCQINVLKPFVSCPYPEPLAVVMKRVYDLGNLTASLFATEGVASVGLLYAPVVVFVCGLVIAFANRLSAGLPPRFILISSAVLPPLFLNVPLTIILLTHGAALLFLLWYITPREMFDRDRATIDVPTATDYHSRQR